MMNQIMQMFGGGGHSSRSTNIFDKIMERLTMTIDKHMHFERVDDVMYKENPFEGMTEAVVKAQGGDNEQWKENPDGDKKEEAHEDKGRIHVIRRGTLTPIFSLFTIFTYVLPSHAAMKEELGWWTITLTVRDKRIIEKYGTDLKNFTGDVFNEKSFSAMLQEIEMILSYVIEMDNLPIAVEADSNIIDLSTLPDSLQHNIKGMLNAYAGPPPAPGI